MLAKLFNLKAMLNILFNMLPSGNTITLLLLNKIDLLQSNNKHKLLRKLKTKLRCSAIIFIAILASTFTCNASTDTTLTTLQSPVNFGGCVDTFFVVKYYKNHSHVLQIKCTIQNADSSCAVQSGKPQVFVTLDSSNIDSSNFTMDTLNGKLLCYVNATPDTVYIRYKVFIDCANFKVNNTLSKNLIQTFTDTTNYYAFNLGTNIFTNTSIYTGLESPKIVSLSNSQTFYTNYLESTYNTFAYKNFSQAAAKIKFRFYAGDTALCGKGKIIAYEYRTNGMNNFATLSLATDVAVNILPDSILYIRQAVTDTTCRLPNDICKDTVMLQWHCNLPIPPELFCNTCDTIIKTDYTLQSNDEPKVAWQMLSPASNVTSDYSCFNDSANMTTWTYRLVHDTASRGAADTVSILLYLYNSAIGKTNLTIIPRSTIHITKTNAASTIDSTFYYGSAPLCQNYVQDSLYAANYAIYNFRHGDTVTISFKTFKCAAEVDSLLLNKPKILNQWVLAATAWSKCKSYTYTVNALSNEVYIGQYALHQSLDLSPTTNNLSVPHDSIFGDTLLLQVNLKGLTTTPASYAIQYLGCDWYDTNSACVPNGLLRVRVSVGTGLHISQPNTLVHFTIDTALIPVKIFADYYNTLIESDSCKLGAYYFYFNMSKQLMYALNYGKFETVITACCGKPQNDEPVAVQFAFHLMADPSGTCNNITFPTNHISPPNYGNINAAYIPLSATGASMHIHCPGCKAPGIICDSYKFVRDTFGLQDSDNDGIADFPQTYIGTDTSWYAQYKSKLQTNTSSYGDRLRDYYVAHFEDGTDATTDSTPAGYTYAMMNAKNAFLKYLQIAIIIPDSANAYGITPTGFDFYVDERNTITPDCKDCQAFQVDTLYRTKLKIHVPQADLSTFLTKTNDTYFYSFSTKLFSQYYLLQFAYLAHYDTINPFSTFEVNQRYRMSVSYDECKTFSAGSLPTLETAKHECEITVQNWLSGEPKPYNAFAFGIDMPNDTNDLDSVGWTFNQNFHPDDSLVNQTFADSYIFYCEFNGTMHYFYSQDVEFIGEYTSTGTDCNLLLTVVGKSRTAGDIKSLHTYSYEYRPPSLAAFEYKIKALQGYTPVSAIVYNALYFNPQLCNGSPCPTNTIAVAIPTVTNDGYLIFDSLPPLTCLDESLFTNGVFANNSAFIKNDMYERKLQVLFKPDECSSQINMMSDTAYTVTATKAEIPCIQWTTCSDTTITRYADNFKVVNENKPNLQVAFTPYDTIVTKKQLAWRIEIKNPKAVVDTINGVWIETTVASNLYLQVPNLTYLNNWQFKNDDSTNFILPYSGSLFKISKYLSVNDIITGTITCDYIDCQDSSMIPFVTGYNCDSFPASPLQVNDVCQAIFDTVYFKNAIAAIGTSNIATIDFSLCKDFIFDVNYFLTNQGDVYPDSIFIGGLPIGINVQSVAIKNCTNGIVTSLPFANGNYHIPLATMYNAGFEDSVLSQTNNANCLQLLTTLLATCGFVDGTYNTTITLYAHNFCGDTLTNIVQGFNFHYNDTNNCTDCFTITKTANTDTLNVNDTITYTVTVIANNGSPQSVIVSDLFPNNFTVIPPNPFPAYIVLDAQGDSTFTVQGYFTVSNGCDSTWNVAMLSNATDTITDSVCVQVNPPCFEDKYEVIADSVYSSIAYPNGVITNDTILLTGRFYINANFSIINCVIITYPGSNIIVLGNATLTDSLNIYYSCTDMWKGIYLEENANIVMKNSRLYDAENGVWARKSNGVFITGSGIFNCITGVRMQEPNMVNKTQLNNCYGYIYDNEIAQDSKLKPWYAGQTFTDTVMYASIYLQNVKFDIGDLTQPQNKLHHAANGVIAHNAITRIRNTEAYFIKPNSMNGNRRSAAYSSFTDTGAVISNMTVLPLTNPITATAHDSWRGVYSSASHLNVIGNIIKDVAIGVSINNNHNMQKATVFGNIIIAGSRGVSCNNNAGGAGCNIENNVIVMSGTSTAKGINIAETNNLQTTNYTLLANHVTINNARSAIEVNNTYKTLIASNTVRVTSNIDTVTNGISLNGCKQANVNCNNVKGNNPNDTNAIGIATQIGIATSGTDYSTILCNTVDSTAYGFFFGGSCLGTTFRGNDMYKHLHSLYLNKVAVIDTQQHAGNRWNDLNNPFNAVNQNDSTFFTLTQSLFITNPASGLVYNPTFPVNQNVWPFVNDQGWFYNDTGATFHCGNTLCRDISSNLNISPNILEAIVRDSVITSDYLTESQSINRTSAYEAFMGDSILTWSDVEYHNFVTANEHEATGMLYIVKVNFAKMNAYDFSFVEQIYLIDSTIKNIVLQLNEYDSLVLLSNVNVNIAARQNLLDILILQVENRNNLFTQRETYIANLLSEAASRLGLTITDELPQTNDKMLYEMEIDLQTNGESVFENHLSTLFFVAAQCPYSGGNAVYKARAYLESLFDSLYWDDRNVCFNEGIYRHGNISSLLNTANIIVKPNPSNGILEIVKLKALQNNCRIKIQNALGKNVFELLIDCKQGSQFIDVQSLANGVYTLTILSDNLNQLTQKIVILK